MELPAGWTHKAYCLYIASAEWKAFRARIIAERGKRCANPRCHGTDDEIHLHHLTYERLGNEWPEDVELLCRTCHEDHHDYERAEQEEAIRQRARAFIITPCGAAMWRLAYLTQAHVLAGDPEWEDDGEDAMPCDLCGTGVDSHCPYTEKAECVVDLTFPPTTLPEKAEAREDFRSRHREWHRGAVKKSCVGLPRVIIRHPLDGTCDGCGNPRAWHFFGHTLCAECRENVLFVNAEPPAEPLIA
jgi:hypothetical protein